MIQSLFAVGMNLQALAAATDDEQLAQRLEAAVEDVDHAIRDLRNYIFGLRPGILADRQLDQAIKELASEFDARSGVVTVVEVDAEAAPSSPPAPADVVQLVREALSNVGTPRRRDHLSVSLVARGPGTRWKSTTTARGSIRISRRGAWVCRTSRNA